MQAYCLTCKAHFPMTQPCNCGHKHCFPVKDVRKGRYVEIAENGKPTGRFYQLAYMTDPIIGEVTAHDPRQNGLKVQLAPNCEVFVIE